MELIEIYLLSAAFILLTIVMKLVFYYSPLFFLAAFNIFQIKKTSHL